MAEHRAPAATYALCNFVDGTALAMQFRYLAEALVYSPHRDTDMGTSHSIQFTKLSSNAA
jgi:type VI protein secretion system component VasF